jgi:hypothetical protein
VTLLYDLQEKVTNEVHQKKVCCSRSWLYPCQELAVKEERSTS